MRTGRTLHANLHLLDRQVVEEGTERMVAKVDDLELERTGDRLFVSAILTGPQAWGPRLPGLLGRFVVSVHHRLHSDHAPEPARIPVSFVVDVDSAVAIVRGAPIDVQGFGRWVDDQFISRIPGAGDAPE